MSDLSITTDQECVRAVCDGKDDAFEHIYDRYEDDLFGYFSSTCSPNDCQDLCMKTLKKLFRCIKRGEVRYFADGSIRPLVFSIAAGCKIEYYREPRHEMPMDPASLPNDTLYPADYDDYDDTLTQAKLLVSNLPSLRRESITLRFLQGFSEEEIAHILGTTTNAVHGIIKRTVPDMIEAAKYLGWHHDPPSGSMTRAVRNLVNAIRKHLAASHQVSSDQNQQIHVQLLASQSSGAQMGGQSVG